MHNLCRTKGSSHSYARLIRRNKIAHNSMNNVTSALLALFAASSLSALDASEGKWYNDYDLAVESTNNLHERAAQPQTGAARSEARLTSEEQPHVSGSIGWPAVCRVLS